MPLEIAVLLLPRFSLMALSAVLEPFRIANRLAERELYHWRFVSPEAGPIQASSGLPITAELSVRDPITAQRVIVCTSFEPMAAAGRDVLRWLRRLDTKGAELWAVDTGAFLLAEAGLLEGRTVTLHWESSPPSPSCTARSRPAAPCSSAPTASPPAPAAPPASTWRSPPSPPSTAPASRSTSPTS